VNFPSFIDAAWRRGMNEIVNVQVPADEKSGNEDESGLQE
jgi:hypothetical protein